MTDKQIIIDGVQVQDCCYFDYENDGYKDSCYIHQNECSAQNCYYKQLKRKEQECEALRMSENEAVEIIAELKAENDTLRQFLSKEPLALQALQSTYSSYKKSTDVFYEMVKQYKQILTEIKGLAENMNKKCFYDDFDCMNCDVQNGCTYFNKKQILQKISESEVENKYNTKDIMHINENNQEYIAEGNRMTK